MGQCSTRNDKNRDVPPAFLTYAATGPVPRDASSEMMRNRVFFARFVTVEFPSTSERNYAASSAEALCRG